MARQPRVLVCGAAGRVGGTGRRVALNLLSRGFEVRAFVRREDERSKVLRERGAEVVVGDLLDYPSVRSAMDDVSRAYLTCSLTDQLAFISTVFAAAAEQAGLEGVVNMSQYVIEPDDVSPMTRQHWAGERILDWSGVPTVHLRCAIFSDALVILGARGLNDSDELRFAFGKAQFPPVAAADVADVATAVLASPGPFVARTLHLSGPETLSTEQMGDAFSRALGRRILYRDLTEVEYEDQLRELGLDEWHVVHLSRLARKIRKRDRTAVTSVIEEVAGHPATSLEDTVRSYAERGVLRRLPAPARSIPRGP